MSDTVSYGRPFSSLDALEFIPHTPCHMIKGFWKHQKKPILALAPMADVTDAAFRRMIAKYGKPDVMWTEFVSCDGLASRGREKLLIDLLYSEIERPIIAQVFGAKPEHFYTSALLIQELGFDGIDINMGCPVKMIEKQGAGAALMKDPKLAQHIIRETIRGAGPLPVSVKTRLGYNTIQTDEWIPHLLETDISALTIHGRTRKEMSLVPARWDEIAKCAQLARSLRGDSAPLILGNGDVETVDDALGKCAEYGVDGVMIGRGVFGNPWLFRKDGYLPTLNERLRVMIEHTYLYEELFSGKKSLDLMKKHYKAYVSGFDGAKELRVKLMTAKNGKDAEHIVKTAGLI